MLILGLTGGIATGKTTVSQYFSSDYQIPVIDADKIAREIVEPNTPCYKAIVEHFKPLIPDLLLPANDASKNKPLNRASLGAYVFTHKEELKILNSITHPAVRKRIYSLLFQAFIHNEPVVILDVPLLFESGLDWICSRTLTISCDYETQLQRLLQRNNELTPDQAKNRINSQMKMTDKMKLSDYVIDNNSDIEALRQNLANFVKQHLPAHSSNKTSSFRYALNSWWNWFQFIFPPFAIIGAAVSLIRKIVSKYFC
jgi:dephospho-CoA kinase